MNRTFLLLGCVALLAMSGVVSAAQMLAERTVEADAASVAPLVEGREEPKFEQPKMEQPKVESVVEQTPKVDLFKGELARGVFCKQISNREPADEVTELGPDVQRVYFFSEVINMAGHTVTHRWEYNGQYMGEVKFNVQSPKWRVWSYKTVSGGKDGIWSVKVLDTAGETVGEKSLAPPAVPPAQ